MSISSLWRTSRSTPWVSPGAQSSGGDQTRLTFDDLSDFLPSWSPDGRKIAFSSFRDATEEDFNSEIYTMRADGSNLANLTRNLAFDGESDWQPLDDHHSDD